MVKIVVQYDLGNSTIIGKDRCTVTMESASDRRRRLARERLQRCHLADLKLFFPLTFSHSRSSIYVRTALLVHVTIQIFVVVPVVVVFVVSCNWFFPANHKSVSVLFLFTCILYIYCFCLHVFSTYIVFVYMYSLHILHVFSTYNISYMYCIAFLLLREAFLRMRIPSIVMFPWKQYMEI